MVVLEAVMPTMLALMALVDVYYVKDQLCYRHNSHFTR